MYLYVVVIEIYYIINLIIIIVVIYMSHSFRTMVKSNLSLI